MKRDMNEWIADLEAKAESKRIKEQRKARIKAQAIEEAEAKRKKAFQKDLTLVAESTEADNNREEARQLKELEKKHERERQAIKDKNHTSKNKTENKLDDEYRKLAKKLFE